MLVLRRAPPAHSGIQILGAGHVSVIMQWQFQQFVEFFVPPVQFLDRMVGIPDRGDLTGTVLGWFWTRPLLCNNRCLGGVAQCFVRRWIHVMHHPGWLLEEFYDFLHEGVDSAPELDSRPALLP